MFPLSTVLFPEATLPLHVFEERYRSLMADCLGPEGEGEFGVVLITRGSEVGGGDQRVDVGTVARIAQVAELDDGRMLVVAHGERRVRVDRWLAEDPYPRARVEDLPADEGDGEAVVVAQAETAVRRLRALLSELGDVPALPLDLEVSAHHGETGWRLCASAPLNLIDRQRLLACAGRRMRMELLGELCTAMADDVLSLLAGGPGE
jgi:uncharacterized protein